MQIPVGTAYVASRKLSTNVFEDEAENSVDALIVYVVGGSPVVRLPTVTAPVVVLMDAPAGSAGAILKRYGGIPPEAVTGVKGDALVQPLFPPQPTSGMACAVTGAGLSTAI